MGEHGQGDVAVPGVVAANLIVIEPDFGLRGLEAVLNDPSCSGHANEVVISGCCLGTTQLAGQLVLHAGLIHDQYALTLAQVTDRVRPNVIAHPIGVPGRSVESGSSSALLRRSPLYEVRYWLFPVRPLHHTTSPRGARPCL